MGDRADADGRWLDLAAAAAALGLPSADALRKRIRRSPGDWEVRRANDGRLQVRVDPDGTAVRPPVRPRGADADAWGVVAVHLLTAASVQAVRAEAAEREVARLEAHLADLRAELARRRWPGLRRWWRRVWEGEG